MIITIDGPIATGKSTIAKALARELGFIFFDTGAMYRCLTYAILAKGIPYQNPQALEEFLKTFSFEIKIKLGEKHYFIEKADVTDKIRGAEVTSAVSKISAIKSVREKLVALQKQLSLGVNAVFEGRDMGTTVFPQADIKIYLTGNIDIRSKRRFDELRAKYPEDCKALTLEQVQKEIAERDHYDMNREISPLRQAPDAYVIDTSNHSVHDIVNLILEYRDSIKAHKH